ncbi:hypothetical protein RF11_10231 [Thelohanellus kitauei]|uniref:Uncharacterized protein n=1 Tax=Thelohanellus kitauei TaxID=669202 RepID=A0A0C2NG15_THEKT|nr:hypothetical protein RF11_07604 [Thelohanellus kitauei]KII72947.1 hypothetical protein RF11_10231 [Thelohanellus kitauei]
MTVYLHPYEIKVDFNKVTNDELAELITNMIKSDGVFDLMKRTGFDYGIDSEHYKKMKEEIDEEIKKHCESLRPRPGLNKFRMREELINNLKKSESLIQSSELMVNECMERLKPDIVHHCTRYSAFAFKSYRP